MTILQNEALGQISGGGLFSCILSTAGMFASVVDMTVGFATIVTPLGWVALTTGTVGLAASVDGMNKNC